MSLLANRLKSVKPSKTLAVNAKAKELAKKGMNIISLAAGEPDFDTPENIKQAAIDAINSGRTKYTAVGGTNELKNAVIEKFKRENNLSYSAEEIIIGTGGKQVIYNLFMASLNEEDEVIIPSPYWVSYPDMVALSGGTPVIVNTYEKDNFKLKAESLEESITKKTKWLILNSPSNPTGAAYDENDIEEIAEIMRKYPHVNIMCDDIYEHIIYDDFKFKTFAEIAPDLKNRIFIVNGVSKSYSMTGWRIGYGAGSAELIKAMTMVQSQSTSNPSSISQYAAVAALTGEQNYIKTNTENFQKKRDLAMSCINKIEGLECNVPEGAFYLFIKCRALFGKQTSKGDIIKNSSDFSSFLLEYSNVAVVPGVAFGAEGYIRASYATSEDLIKQAFENISNAIAKLK